VLTTERLEFLGIARGRGVGELAFDVSRAGKRGREPRFQG